MIGALIVWTTKPEEAPAETRTPEADARERRQERLALALSRDALEEFHAIRALSPDLRGELLYERILSTCFGVDGAIAHHLVEAARQSVAESPPEHGLRFCDVVHYFIADQCLKRQPSNDAHWIREKIGDVVRSVIPQTL